MKTMGNTNGECFSRKVIFPLEKLKIISQKSVNLEVGRARRGGDVRRQFYIFKLSLAPSEEVHTVKSSKVVWIRKVWTGIFIRIS